MPEAAIALGSNLVSPHGDRAQNLHTALEHLARLGQIRAVSSFHDTEPVGYLDQPRFLNAAAVLSTSLAPADLLDRLLATEQQMGRRRADDVPAKGPRLIDLDLLLYDAQIIRTGHLIVPHPEMHRRRFVLEPLAEIAPDWLHPGLGLTVRELLAALAP